MREENIGKFRNLKCTYKWLLRKNLDKTGKCGEGWTAFETSINNKVLLFSPEWFPEFIHKAASLHPVAKVFETCLRFGRCCVIYFENVYKTDKCYLDQGLARNVLMVVVMLSSAMYV